MLNNLSYKIFKSAKEKGLYDRFYDVLTVMNEENKKEVETAFMCQLLLLVVAEVAEATEALRDNNKAAFREEFADIMIMLFSIAGYAAIDLDRHVTKKMAANESRPDRHGKSF